MKLHSKTNTTATPLRKFRSALSALGILVMLTITCFATPVQAAQFQEGDAVIGIYGTSNQTFLNSGITAYFNYSHSASWMIESITFWNANDETIQIAGSAIGVFNVPGHYKTVTVPFNVYQNRITPVKSVPFHYIIAGTSGSGTSGSGTSGGGTSGGGTTSGTTPLNQRPMILVGGFGTTLIMNHSNTEPYINSLNGQLLGTVSQRGGVARTTFTIKNNGGVTLLLSGAPVIRLSGADAAQFRVAVQPATSIGPNSTASTSFAVEYVPTVPGNHRAAVQFTTNDSYNTNFDFTVGGHATFVVSNEPAYFEWTYNSQPSPGLRIWQRSGSVWTERYPNGATNTYDYVGRTSLTNQYMTNAQGEIVRNRADSRAEVFISDLNWTQAAYGVWYRYNGGAWGFLGSMRNSR